MLKVKNNVCAVTDGRSFQHTEAEKIDSPVTVDFGKLRIHRFICLFCMYASSAVRYDCRTLAVVEEVWILEWETM